MARSRSASGFAHREAIIMAGEKNILGGRGTQMKDAQRFFELLWLSHPALVPYVQRMHINGPDFTYSYELSNVDKASLLHTV
ncbi:hypothetical protein Hypma_013787 [Hypsizygus marmoreus]|uniref:Uncharacterized protein n=1 Tax=Hypsizygus marmoreus TaxID=39966 RepID=A0A369KFM7_HYPMA|nr:hypothetical protein Hypma_013787 [Hypsizygus marmoreus]